MQKLDRRKFLLGSAGVAGGALLAQVFPFRNLFAQQTAAIAGTAPTERFAALAQQYDIGEGITYLNHASIGTMPTPVREAFFNYIKTCESNPWLHIWGDVWKEAYKATRERAAKHWRCSVDEIALTHNTTESFNILAAGLDLKKKDEILYSSLNHAGARVCWEHYAETRGYTVKEFDWPFKETAEMDAEDFMQVHLEQITKRTRVIVLPHIDNVLGIRLPIKELGDAARKKGVAYIAVDGAQTAGMIPLDMKALDCDFYATSTHKWVQSSKERGMFYVREELLDKVRPFWVTWGKRMWSGDSRKFEDFGTRNVPAMLALDDALKFQESLGEEAKEQHLKMLWEHSYANVKAAKHLTWRSPRKWELNGSLFAIEVKDQIAKDVFDTMYEKHGFVFRPFAKGGMQTLRISPNVMTTIEDMDRFYELLAKEFG